MHVFTRSNMLVQIYVQRGRSLSLSPVYFPTSLYLLEQTAQRLRLAWPKPYRRVTLSSMHQHARFATFIVTNSLLLRFPSLSLSIHIIVFGVHMTLFPSMHKTGRTSIGVVPIIIKVVVSDGMVPVCEIQSNDVRFVYDDVRHAILVTTRCICLFCN